MFSLKWNQSLKWRVRIRKFCTLISFINKLHDMYFLCCSISLYSLPSSKKYSFDFWIFIFPPQSALPTPSFSHIHTMVTLAHTTIHTHLWNQAYFIFYVAFSYLPNLCWFLSQLLLYSWHLPYATIKWSNLVDKT